MAVLLLLVVCGTAAASPLSASADKNGMSATPVWVPLTPDQLLNPDPKLDTRADAFLFGTPASMQGAIQQPAEWDFQSGRNERSAHMSGPGLADQLRYLVNVEPGSGATAAQGRGGSRGARADPAAFAGIDMGEAADQWLRDTVKSLVDSTLRLEVNERGRASFSVLGLGDFAFSVSADRSQIALTEGNEALFVVDRMPAANGRDPASGSPYGLLPAARPGSEQPAIKEMMELVADVASHPISLLLYCVVAAYLVLWSILSRQQKKSFAPRYAAVPSAVVARERPESRRQARSGRRRRHSRRSRT